MAFDSLSEKLQNVFKNLRSKGRLTEDDVKAALKEVKMALLEADVNFKVVKQFVKDVQERAIGQDVMNGLNPGQMVIKIVNEEMVRLMGSETTEIALRPGKELTIIMMAGLQGAGKTTTTAKIAGKLKAKGKKVLLAACDVYRPAAIEQLQINGEKQGVEVFSMGDKNTPVNIAKAAVEHATKNDFNVLIIDTAGRLHVDEDMMAELIQIKENVAVSQTILVVDAMTGQDAVNVAQLKAIAGGTGSIHFVSVKGGNASSVNYNNDGAKETGAIAIGANAEATANSAVAMGFNAQSNGSGSIVIGESSGLIPDASKRGASKGNSSIIIGTENVDKGGTKDHAGSNDGILGSNNTIQESNGAFVTGAFNHVSDSYQFGQLSASEQQELAQAIAGRQASG